MFMSKEERWKRFLDYVNGLSPWNLWINWQDKIQKRKLRPAVKDSLDDLLNN